MKLFAYVRQYDDLAVPDHLARITFVNRVDGEHNVLARYVIIRWPFKRWRCYVDPQSFKVEDGWCIRRTMFGFVYSRRNFFSCSVWVPIEVGEM